MAAPALGVPPGRTVQGPYFPSRDESNMGMLIHLLSIFTGFLAPLIIWLIKRDESRFIDHNGKQSLNFQISLIIYYLGLGVISIATLGFALILTLPAMLGLWVASLVFEIVCCVKASRGEWPRYPLCIPFLR